jgi:uncharacterized protein
MKSKVYFAKTEDAENIAQVNSQLGRLLATSQVLDIIGLKEKAAVKLHFGEKGNTGYVRPAHLRVICDEIKRKGGSAFLSDANTLYRGHRTNSKDHLAIAQAHGFSKKAVGVDIFIPDDSKEEDTTEIEINQKFIKTAQIGSCFVAADAIVAVTHFKGHGLTGFGGTLKNLGMGCAMRKGKLAQHCDITPAFYPQKCTGCGSCAEVCPVEAIQIADDKSVIDSSKCIGCASCVAACPSMALFINLEAGDEVQEKIVEYASAVLKNKKGKAVFISFVLRVTKECDCWSFKNPRIAPDIGVLASLDPVAIDKAGFDLVNTVCGKNLFKEVHPDHNALKQLEYAQELGLGNMDYELINL